MITDSFNDEKAIIEAEMIYGKNEKTLDVCLMTFSHEVFKKALEMEGSVVIGQLSVAMGKFQVVKLPIKEKRVGIFLSPVGAPAAGGFMEDCSALFGVDTFILFGSCGSLDQEKTEGRYIVPVAAYRDEGMSYHYLPPSDYVEINTWKEVSDFFSMNNIPFVTGSTWTTDAFYRETRSEMEKRKKEGCLVVEMEIAGCQAVAAYRGWKFYAFLEGGDKLDGEEWSVGELGSANHNKGKLFLAMELAKKV